ALGDLQRLPILNGRGSVATLESDWTEPTNPHMTTTRDDLHARIDHLPDEQLDHAAALLDALADAAEPPGRAATADDAVKSLFPHQARAQQAAHDTASTPLPLALEALGDYVGARPGLTRDLLAQTP